MSHQNESTHNRKPEITLATHASHAHIDNSATHHHDVSHSHGHDHGHGHNHSLVEELICHVPYAIFSVAFSLIVLSFLAYASQSVADPKMLKKGYKMLFHSFHFMHIVFAATGTLITYFRFSKNMLAGLVMGIISPTLFCTLSDSILPYLGGRALGVSMHFHMCFLTELPNVLPFLFVGILNGILMSWHSESRQSQYSLFSHFVHIFISSLASSFYLVAHGFTNWYSQIGSVFLFLIFAVVIPCTVSDVIVPMLIAKAHTKDEKH